MFLKSKFTEWYSIFIAAQLDEGKAIENVEVKLKLSVLKPLQAKWIMYVFNYLTSENCRVIIFSGLKATFISVDICSGLNGVEPLDPF